MNSITKWSGEKKKLNSIRLGKVNDESFYITFILLGICLRDNNLHFEYGVIQVSTKDTHGNVDRLETYFKSYPHIRLSRLCIKTII